MPTDVQAVTSARRRSATKVGRRILKHWEYYLLVLVPMAYIVIFKYVPMVGAQIAFRDFNVIEGMWGSPWVGLREFTRFFESPSFRRLIENTFSISLTRLLLGFPAPIILALALNEISQRSFKRSVQMVTYAPHFISTVVMASMIILFLTPRLGLFGVLMRAAGVQPVNYLAVASHFKFVYALSDIWQHAGYGAIIYMAALAAINPELYEAARIDGASRLQKIIHVDIPGIMPVMVILLILEFGEIMEVGFEKIYLLQNPVNISASEIIQTYVYKIGIINASFSFASAVGLFNSVINFILLVGVNAAARRISSNSLW
ncbi:MAG: ABC transporter permease subunit [Spirochaetaceae bacterium]|nr:ABC transporter permease subunit [Spirochaetaceae bacterium]